MYENDEIIGWSGSDGSGWGEGVKGGNIWAKRRNVGTARLKHFDFPNSPGVLGRGATQSLNVYNMYRYGYPYIYVPLRILLRNI